MIRVSLKIKIVIAVAGVFLIPALAFASFDRDLFFGMKGAEVSALQQFLKDQGPAIYPDGLVTGYFGVLTQGAVKKFQAAHKIIPVAGYFGPKTRRATNDLLRAAASVSPPAATTAPVFLKIPRVVSAFSEVKIVDAEADQLVGYILVCGRSMYPSPSGTLLTFRVDPYTHYNCQFTAKNSFGNAVSLPISFDSSEWLEVSSSQSTLTPGLSIQFGTLILTNNSAKIITLTGLPVKLTWSLSSSGSSSSVNIGANVAVAAKNSAGFTYGKSVVMLGAAQNTALFTIGLGNTALASGQVIKVLLNLEDLRASLAGGEWFQLESASSTAPVDIIPRVDESSAFNFRRAP